MRSVVGIDRHLVLGDKFVIADYAHIARHSTDLLTLDAMVELG